MPTLNQTVADIGAQRHEQSMKDRVGAVADQAKSAAQEIKHSAEKHGAEALQNAKELGSEACSMAQERYEQVRDVAGDYLQQGQKRAVELEHTVESQIRRQPVQSVLIAAGIGFALGFLFIRR